jgi:hypothetical protein
MNKVIIERAVQALAALNGPRRHQADSLRVRDNPPVLVAQPDPKISQKKVACGMPHCAGCYGVGDGRKIHPPKIGEDYRKWLERWKPRGSVQ